MLRVRAHALRLCIGPNAFGNALGSSLADQIGRSQSEATQAKVRSDTRQAIASGGTGYVLDELIKRGVGVMEATLISNSDSVRDSVGIVQAMAAAEKQTGSNFDSLPMAQQTAVLRSALAVNSASGATLIDRMHEQVVESGDSNGYGGVIQRPSVSPVEVYGSRDIPGGFISTAANVLDRTNAAVASVIDVVGPERAEFGMLGIQVAVGGLPRTALAYAGNFVLGGVRQDLSEKFSGLIAENAFDVSTASPERAKDIWTVSRALGSFGVDAAFGTARDVVTNVLGSRAVLNAVDARILAKRNNGRSPYSEINGAIGEAHGLQRALDAGHISIARPGKASVQGPDFITFDPSKKGVVVWDSKYRGPNGSYPSSLPQEKLTKWQSEIAEAVRAMPEGPAKVDALRALQAGRVTGQIFKWPQ